MALTQTAVPTTPSEKATTKLPVPASTRPFRIAWFYASGIIGCHLIALLAVLPWFYSRTGVILAILGLYVFGTLGINPWSMLSAGHACTVGRGSSASPSVRR
jgi:hypothetical protein